MKDYLQLALTTFNGGMWYGWKKYNDDGSRIPDAERKNYENIIVIKDGATKPSEEEINAKIQELKDAEADKETKKASAKQKLLDLGLTEEEIKLTFGV
nr:hypothetical protein [uncultured Mediterranean phage uvMED]